MSLSLRAYMGLVILASLIVLAAVLGDWPAAIGVACLQCAFLLSHSVRRLTRKRRSGMPRAEDRQRLQAILAATFEGVIALDRQGRITLLNHAAEQLLGTAENDVLGLQLHEAFNNPKLEKLAAEASSGGQKCRGEVNHQTKVLEVYATMLEGNQGAVLLLHDLTEIRRLESVRTDFVANVSHELKTPLTSIRAYVDTLMDGGLSDPENNVRFVEKIEKHVDRLAVLITDLLSLSRIESGQAISQHARLDLLEPLQEAVGRLGPSAESKGIHLHMEIPDEPLEMLGDREALQQVFDNLIDNAIKYTDVGGKVVVTAQKLGSKISLRVRDTGVGIPREDLPRVFERFYRVDKARSRELGGTGLGLSIVKHCVQALEGEVHVESTVGQGTTFVVKFPSATVGNRR